MKILALNWQDLKNPQGGGAEVHIWENLKRFAAWGHQVTLLCSDFKGSGPEDFYDGIQVFRAGKRHNFNFVAPSLVKKALGRQPYDILLMDVNKIPFYSRVFSKLPLLIVIPHLFATTVFREINFLMGAYIYLMELPMRWVYRNARYCVISRSTHDDLVARGLRGENVTVIECGIDNQTFSHDPAVGKYELPTAIYLGRIKKYKSIQHLLAAWPQVLKQVPNARLQVVGTGDHLDRLKQLAARLRIERTVEFPGFVPVESKVERMRKAWCTVYPSLKEGWGLTNIEANACGTPALAADAPGLRDSVANGKSGLLFQYGDVDGIAQQVIRVFTDVELRNRLNAGALEWARRFDWDDSARRLLALMEEIVAK